MKIPRCLSVDIGWTLFYPMMSRDAEELIIVNNSIGKLYDRHFFLGINDIDTKKNIHHS